MSDAYSTIRSLRAIRSFRTEPLTDDHLIAVLQAGRWTGSSKNRQDWGFVIVADPEQRDRLAACGDFTDPVRNAPVTIALVQTPGGYEFDVGRVAQNMMLAASTLGVASCPVTLHRDADAAAVLQLPEAHRCRYAVTFGYPAPSASPARGGGRRPLSDLVHREVWGVRSEARGS